MRPLRAWLQALLLLALALSGVAARGHEMTMAEMTVREMQSGQLLWSWGIPAAGKPIAAELRVRWPGDCREEEERRTRSMTPRSSRPCSRFAAPSQVQLRLRRDPAPA